MGGRAVKRSRAKKEKRFWVGGISAVFFFSILLLPPQSSVGWAAEEVYPNRPINLVISMAPGGNLDTQGKIIGDRLGEVLGQPVLRVHKPGGGGVLAASFVAKSKPDGYTLITGTSTNLILSPIMKKLDYGLKDFTPLRIFGKGVTYIFVKRDAPWKNIQEFVADAKERPLKVSSYGRNTHAEVVIEAFSKQAGIKLAHVPYKSCSEAVTALLGGHVDADFCSGSVGQVAAGAVRILAVADYERFKIYPDVPTLKESGYPVTLPALYSLLVPSRTPAKVVDTLAKGMQEVFKRYGKEIQEELIRLEFIPLFYDSARSIKEYDQDYEVTLKIVRELGMTEK
jgi:tripartite-type tricarboxylate transporter receptor subunit TctC